MDFTPCKYFWGQAQMPYGSAVWPDILMGAPLWHTGFFCPTEFYLQILLKGEVIQHMDGHKQHLRAGAVSAYWPQKDANLESVTDPFMICLRLSGPMAYDFVKSCGFSPQAFVQHLPLGDVVDPAEKLMVLFSKAKREDRPKVYETLYSLVDLMPRAKPAQLTHPDTPQLIHQAETLMQTWVSEPYNIEDICNALGISKATLWRLYKKHQGVSPKDRITRLRLREAKRLLKETDLKVSAVAKSSGFTAEKNFYRRFLAVVGETPASFRTRARKQRGPI